MGVMETFSFWNLNTKKSYDETIQNMIDYEGWKPVNYDTVDSERDLQFLIEVDNSDEYKLEISDDESFRFSKVLHSWERVVSTESNNKDVNRRIKQSDLEFLVCENSTGQVFFIAFKGLTANTKTALRSANNFSGKKEITENSLDVSEDIFYWLFNRYMNFETEELFKGTSAYVNALTAYRGGTDDEANDTWGRGLRITKILATLAFLFNTEKLKSLTPELSVDNINLTVEINLNGSYKFDVDSHTGNFFLYQRDKKKGCLLIYFYKVIYPTILKAYKHHLDVGSWNEQMKLNFISSIGAEIQDKVKEKLDDIKFDLGNETENLDNQ
ncbi:hypothetical protein [Shouchella shacheensis]|uniref:hypothetical protein n=1 Tax=Shouchella shacheensis TaxID=1649580 RepID=UPI0007404FF8|nr:hypothetical protein [Shouchella shacheensis]